MMEREGLFKSSLSVNFLPAMCAHQFSSEWSAAGRIFLLTVGFFSLHTNAENVKRSDAQTEGEKRLLEWDLNKTYDLSRNRTNSGTKAPSRAFETRTLGTGLFTTKAFYGETFSAPEFLPPNTSRQTSRVTTKPFLSVNSADVSKPFRSVKPSEVPKVLPNVAARPALSPENFKEASRSYQGSEASRKDRGYLPENAPRGGVIEGRVLSIEEVKEILNKSK